MSSPWDDPRIRAGLLRQLAMRRRLLDERARHVGWKVGFGAPAALELLQITAPLVGFLTDATVLPAGSTVSTGGWNTGIVEFEVAVYLGSGLPPGASEEQARGAIAAVGPAIELANIDLDPDASTVEDILAGDIFHEAVIFGDRDPGRAGLEVEGLTARILIDGEKQAETADLQAITGDYARIVTAVADVLADAGEALRAGDLIITGSVIPPIPVTQGAWFTFVLDPFDPISVQLEGASTS